MAKLCAFGKEVKKRLVDIDRTQEWLCRQVKEDTGLFIDSAYMSRILYGKLSTPSIVASISKILGIPVPTNAEER